MNRKGKSINLYLLDGEVTGRIKASIPNWNILAFKIPHADLAKSANRDELNQSGVYLLFGSNDDGNQQVYIGQAGRRKNGKGLLMRITEHTKGSDPMYFHEAIVLTTQSDTFGPTEISYLENRFTKLATYANRYNILNDKEPNIGNPTEEKESELEEFIDQAKMLIGALGYKVFVPLVKENEDAPLEITNEDYTLYLKRKTGKDNKEINAKCKRTNEGFVVLAGSTINETDSAAMPKKIREEREKAREDKNIVGGVLQKNLLFSSPSYAAAFVLGMQSNGRIEWKLSDGTTLKEYEEREAEKLEVNGWLI